MIFLLLLIVFSLYAKEDCNLANIKDQLVGLDKKNFYSISQPERLLPLAYCTKTGLGIAVPLDDKAYSYFSQKSLNSKKNKLYKYLPSKIAYWTNKNNTNNTVGLSHDFFGLPKDQLNKSKKTKKDITSTSSVPAIISFTKYNSNDTAKIVVDQNVYYVNSLVIPALNKVFDVSCFCVAGLKDSCTPNVHIKHGSIYKPYGHVLSLRSTTGKDGNMGVLFNNERIVLAFRNLTESNSLVWPYECSISSNQKSTSLTFIKTLCPVDQHVDGRAETIIGVKNSALTVLSFNPLKMSHNESTHISCKVALITGTNQQELMQRCSAQNNVTKRVLIEYLEGLSFDKDSPISKNDYFMKFGRHADLSGHSGEKQKELFITETRSRVNKLENSILNGEFGEKFRSANNLADYVSNVVSEEGANPIFGIPNSFGQLMIRPFSLQGTYDPSIATRTGNITLPGLYLGGLNSTRSANQNANFGFRGYNLYGNMIQGTQDYVGGFSKKKYGVQVENALVGGYRAFEARARNFTSLTTADAMQRIFGQKIGIRNFGLGIRRDLGQIFSSANLNYGSEFYFNYKNLNISFGLDILNTRYITSIGVLGVNVLVAHDFNAYGTTVQINWGKGWQIFLENITPTNDPLFNTTVNGYAVGLGTPTKRYYSVGFGLNDNGIPVSAVKVNSPNTGVTVASLERNNLRTYAITINIGEHAYIWETTLVPESIRLPLVV